VTASVEPTTPSNGKGITPKRCSTAGCNVPSDLVLVDPAGVFEPACFTHAEWLEDERALSRRKGGLKLLGKLRRFTFLTVDDLGELATPEDAQRRAQIICDATATGKLGSAAASVALKALESWLKAHESVALERRLAELEARVAERDAQTERARRARAPGPSTEYLSRQSKP